MTRLLFYAGCTIVALASLSVSAVGSELRESKLESDLVPSPVAYGVVLPDGYGAATEPFPLLLLLHGGKSSHKELATWKGTLDDLWAHGKLPKMVVAMPSTGKATIEGRTEYMDFKDGSEKWYSFVVGPFLDHMRREYNVSREGKRTVVGGVSMGGLGALRVGLRNPGKFAALAAWEPGIMPAIHWKDVKPRNRFVYSDQFLEKVYGRPFDATFWEGNNPAGIVKANAEKIRTSGLQIYIECGDEDYLNLHEGTEFLHRVLWECGIPHEYHLVRGADHLGRTLERRTGEGLQFLGRSLCPEGEDRDPGRLEMIDIWRDLKMEAEKKSPDGRDIPR
jgi:S-formylglutathione hydrolase